jgi:hypothetical protein
MVFVGIIKFLACAIGVFFTCLFILSCISSIIDPKISVDSEGKSFEQGDKPRFFIAIIMAVSWGLVVVL